jgi:hypothetical protein
VSGTRGRFGCSVLPNFSRGFRVFGGGFAPLLQLLGAAFQLLELTALALKDAQQLLDLELLRERDATELLDVRLSSKIHTRF